MEQKQTTKQRNTKSKPRTTNQQQIKAQLLKYRPDLDVQLLRGNINRRIACLENNEYDAIILAVAGLKRLNLNSAYSPIDIDKMPPAASQGTLAVQIYERHPDYEFIKQTFSRLNCNNTRSCVTAERATLEDLDGSCRTPISAYAYISSSGRLHLQAHIYSPDGAESYSASSSSKPEKALELGQKIAQDLLEKHHSAGNDSHMHWLLGQKIAQACRG